MSETKQDAVEAVADGAAKTSAAPAKVARVARPDQQKFDTESTEIRDKIKALQEQQASAKAEIDAIVAATRDVSGSVAEARARIASIRAEQTKVKSERSALIEARNAIRTAQQSRAKAAKAQRETLKYNSSEKIASRIRELEMRQQTEALTLVEEKNLVKELKELSAQRKQIKAIERKASSATGVDAAAGPDQWKTLNTRIDAKSAEMKAIQERMNAQFQILRGFDAERAKKREAVPSLRTKRNELSNEIRALYAELNEKKNAYYKQRNEYRVYQNQVRRERNEQRKKEFARERELAAEQQRKQEEEEANRKPFLREIALCDVLLAQMRALAPQEESKGEVAAPQDVSLVVDGVKLKPSRGHQDEEAGTDWGALVTKGKKGKKKRGKKKGKRGGAQVLRLDLDTLKCFADVSVQAPTGIEDVPRVVKDLEAKRHTYDTAPRPLRPGAQVWTAYGKGKLTAVRKSDKMYVVQLPYGIAYMRKSNVKTEA